VKPVSQACPVKPGGQAQVNALTWLVQTPLLRHGLGVQLSITEDKKIFLIAIVEKNDR